MKALAQRKTLSFCLAVEKQGDKNNSLLYCNTTKAKRQITASKLWPLVKSNLAGVQKGTGTQVR